MPLHDHFRPPLLRRMRWESFHGDWITMLVQRLNTSALSEKYYATGRSRIGSEVEVDVGTLEELAFNGTPRRRDSGETGAVAVATRTYTPPRPSLSGDVEIAEEELFEVQVVSDDHRLVAAIELVSAANKDRPVKRRIFAAKVASYLARGVSVVVVDVVTSRQANLHSDLIDLLQLPGTFAWQSPTNLSAVAYRMIQVKESTRLEVWPNVLKLGEELPIVPLWLAADLAIPLELELTYAETCRGLRIEEAPIVTP